MRDIVSTKENVALVSYKVTISTGNVQNAGTNANVFIVLYGSMGDSGERNLVSNGKDCFERGHTDVFRIYTILIIMIILAPLLFYLALFRYRVCGRWCSNKN